MKQSDNTDLIESLRQRLQAPADSAPDYIDSIFENIIDNVSADGRYSKDCSPSPSFPAKPNAGKKKLRKKFTIAALTAGAAAVLILIFVSLLKFNDTPRIEFEDASASTTLASGYSDTRKDTLSSIKLTDNKLATTKLPATKSNIDPDEVTDPVEAAQILNRSVYTLNKACSVAGNSLKRSLLRAKNITGL